MQGDQGLLVYSDLASIDRNVRLGRKFDVSVTARQIGVHRKALDALHTCVRMPSHMELTLYYAINSQILKTIMIIQII